MQAHAFVLFWAMSLISLPLFAESTSRLNSLPEVEIYSRLKSLHDGARQLHAAQVADGDDIPDWVWHLVVSSRLQALRFLDDQILGLIEIMPENRVREALKDTRRLTVYYVDVQTQIEFWRHFNQLMSNRIQTLEAELFALSESWAASLENPCGKRLGI